MLREENLLYCLEHQVHAVSAGRHLGNQAIVRKKRRYGHNSNYILAHSLSYFHIFVPQKHLLGDIFIMIDKREDLE